MPSPGRKPGFLIDVALAWRLVREECLMLSETAAVLGCHQSTVSKAVNWEAGRRGAPKTCQMNGRADAVAWRHAKGGAR